MTLLLCYGYNAFLVYLVRCLLMLYLTRKPGQSIMINNAVEVTVVEVKGKTVKLGVTFPKDTTVLRKEIYDKVLQENIKAADASMGDATGFFALEETKGK